MFPFEFDIEHCVPPVVLPEGYGLRSVSLCGEGGLLLRLVPDGDTTAKTTEPVNGPAENHAENPKTSPSSKTK